MVSQVVLPPEGLVTDVTSVRPFVCVRALVDQQVVGLSEVAATELAHKLLFRLGRKSSPAGFSFRRGELGHIQQAAQRGRANVPVVNAQIFRLQGVVLRGGRCQVGKVKTRFAFAGCSRTRPGGFLLGGLDEMGEQRD